MMMTITADNDDDDHDNDNGDHDNDIANNWDTDNNQDNVNDGFAPPIQKQQISSWQGVGNIAVWFLDKYDLGWQI